MNGVRFVFPGAWRPTDAAAGPGRSAPRVRVEMEHDDVVISPLLRRGALCEPCWVHRRVSALDPATLATEGVSSPDLLAAFERRCAERWTLRRPEQRDAVVQRLRARAVEACGPLAGTLSSLARVTPTGYVRDEPVLPRPDCAACWGEAVRRPRRRHLANVVGETAGIVTGVQEVPPRVGEPAMPHVAVSRLANMLLNPDRPFTAGASGKGTTSRAAYWAAVGEAVERYAAGIVSSKVVMARRDDVDRAVAPGRLTGVDAAQAAAAGYANDDAEMAWVRARPVAGGDEVWVPASAVYLNLPPPYRRNVAVPSTSSGLACAPTLARAIATARAEVVERHVFFAVWHGLQDAVRPDATALVSPDVVDGFARHGLHLQAAVLGAVGETVVASASCWPGAPAEERPSFTLGLGTGADAAHAVAHAVAEAAQVYRGLTWALHTAALRRRADELADGAAIVEPFDHGLLASRRPPSSVPPPFGSGPPKARAAAGSAAFGVPLYVDLTPRDVAEATGWRVARVLVPDAIPYHCGTNMTPRARLGLAASAPDSVHPLA